MSRLSRTQVEDAKAGERYDPEARLEVSIDTSSGLQANVEHHDRSALTIGGWALFAFIAYKVANSSGGASIYNPFEILGLSEACLRLTCVSMCIF
jgi:preprotein translocase subunit Sec63